MKICMLMGLCEVLNPQVSTEMTVLIIQLYLVVVIIIFIIIISHLCDNTNTSYDTISFMLMGDSSSVNYITKPYNNKI